MGSVLPTVPCLTRLLGNRSLFMAVHDELTTLVQLYRGMKLHRNLFSFVVILHSLLTKQQTCRVPSTREVTIDHVPSLGHAVTTAN